MAGSEFKYATLLFDLAERLRAGELMSSAIIQRLQGCRAAAARDRMDWLEGRFQGRLIDARDARGRPTARRLERPDAERPRDLPALIAARTAATALEHLRGSRLHTALTRADEPLLADLADTDHDRLDRASRVYVRYHPTEIPDARRTNIDRLFDAILDRHPVAFDYVPLSQQRKTYTLAPWLLVDHRATLYLYGRKIGPTGSDATDHRRNFNIDGIESLRVLDDQYASPPPDARHLLRADLAHSVGFFRVADEPVDIRLRATGWFATHLRRSPLHRTQCTLDDQGSTLTVMLRARVCPELCSALMAAQPHVEVLGPTSLADAVRERLVAAQTRIGSA